MPRALKFSFNENEFDCELNKIDRSKLYGSVDVETRDIDGNRCGLATLANDGKTLIPYGGTAFGYINDEGLWIERSDLSPVNMNGESLPLLQSSFDQTIELKEKVSLEEFLDHGARLCYSLGVDAAFEPALLKELVDGAIYSFDFLYRDGVTADPAFILATPDENIWMMVGSQSKINFIGLDQAAVCFNSDLGDEDEEEIDEFDFEML